MNEQKPTKPTKKTNWLNLLIIAFVVFSIGMAGFLGWKDWQLQAEQTQLLQAIEKQKQTLLGLKERQQIGQRMRAAEVLKQAESYRQDWSKVVEDLNQTFPERSKIRFTNVKITRDGDVTVQAQAPDLLSAASFLVLINRSDKFSNGFISQIKPQDQTEGNRSYQFGATFQYITNTES